MGRVLILIATLALTLVPLPALAQGQPPPLYLALGDSLALGVEAPANNDGQPGYPAHILARLRGMYPDIELVNLAVAGETSGTMRSGGQLAAAVSALSGARSIGRCVPVVTLSIGGNDFGRVLTGDVTPQAAAAALSTNLSAILGDLVGAATPSAPGCPPTRVAMMDYYNPYPGLPIPPSDQPLADMHLPTLNGIIRSTAAQYGVAVASVEALFRGREPDLLYVNPGIYTNPLLRLPFTPWFEQNVDFHPRPAGHALIADAFWSVLGLAPAVPALADLPDLIPPTVVLRAPWTCGECAPGGRELALVPPLAEPQDHTIEWLGAQLWNRVTRPLICWLLAMFQAGLNTYAGVMNNYWLPAINDGYRLVYQGRMWQASAVHAVWHLGEDIRAGVWSSAGQGIASAGQALALGETFHELGRTLLQAWVAVFAGAIQPLRYLATLYLAAIPEIVRVLADLEAYRPPQLMLLNDFWLFAAVVGTLRGIQESQIGWWLTAEIALFYLGTALYILDGGESDD